MRNTLETRLGLFVALALIAGVFIMEILGGFERFQKGYQINTSFANIQDLKVGDRVKMAGVDIGKVEGISLTNNRVLVEMKLKKSAPVKTDSIATIKFTGLMGQNYVAVDFGTPSAGTAADGTLIESHEQTDFSAMMEKLNNVASGVENLTKSFTGEKIDNLLGPFTDFLKANQIPLTAAIANMNNISAQVASGKGSIGKMIYDDSLYNSTLATVTNLQSVSDDLQLAIADTRKAVSQTTSLIDRVNSGQGTVGLLLKDESLYRETTASMTNLREILQKMNQGQGTMGKLINDQEFYKNAKMSLQKLDKATEGLEDQGPLSVIGVVAGSLF